MHPQPPSELIYHTDRTRYSIGERELSISWALLVTQNPWVFPIFLLPFCFQGGPGPLHCQLSLSSFFFFFILPFLLFYVFSFLNLSLFLSFFRQDKIQDFNSLQPVYDKALLLQSHSMTFLGHRFVYWHWEVYLPLILLNVQWFGLICFLQVRLT